MFMNPDDPHGSEFGDSELDNTDFDVEGATKTGTTTVGLGTENGVVVATDRRASLKNIVSNKSVVKAEQIHDSGVMTLCGLVGAAQNLIQTVRSESELYKMRRGEPMSISSLAHFAGKLAQSPHMVHVQPLIGGVDAEGSHVYTVDAAGGVMRDDYTATGSGMTFALGHLETYYEDDLSMDEARSVAAGAVNTAAERDTKSGNGLILSSITMDGVEFEKFDYLPDADEV